MVRVSDVPHWTKSAGTTPPLSWSACLNELQVCVRMRMRMGVGVRVRVRRKYLFVLLNKVETGFIKQSSDGLRYKHLVLVNESSK